MTTTTKRPDGGELKPCPFCGDRAWFSGFVVQCKSCGASLIKQERGAAIEAWNTRTPSNESHAPQPPVEGLREDVKRWKLVDGKVTTGESVIFDGSFIIAKVTRREDAELILALLSRDKLQS